MPVNCQRVLRANIPAVDRSEGAHTHARESRSKPLSRQKDLRKGRQPRQDICRPRHDNFIISSKVEVNQDS